MSTVHKKGEKKKNKKKYHKFIKKHSKKRTLAPGVKGFLITCSNESPCIKESYNLLNEFADILYGPEFQVTSESIEVDDEDFEDQLAKEIQEMKQKKRRFQLLSTNVKGIIFIETIVGDPVHLVNSIFENVLQTKKRKGRYILRLLPILKTCKASQDDIKKAIDSYLSEFVKLQGNEVLSYKIHAKIRFNSSISSSDIFSCTQDCFKEFAPKWTVSLLYPEVIISITILKSVCCIGFLKNFNVYKKYNLSELASTVEVDSSISQSVENSDKIIVEEKFDENITEENVDKNVNSE